MFHNTVVYFICGQYILGDEAKLWMHILVNNMLCDYVERLGREGENVDVVGRG